MYIYIYIYVVRVGVGSSIARGVGIMAIKQVTGFNDFLSGWVQREACSSGCTGDMPHWQKF